MDLNFITAISGMVAALIAIVALLLESRRHRFTLGIEILLEFERRFDSDDIRAARAAAARELETGSPGDAVDDVIDFYETIGLLTDRGALDKRLVWSSFYSSLRFYLFLARRHVQDVRVRDATIWRYAVRLEDHLTVIDLREQCLRERTDPAPEAIAEFLRRESDLQQRSAAALRKD